MQVLPVQLIFLIPLLPLIAGIACRGRDSVIAGRIAVIGAILSTTVALLLVFFGESAVSHPMMLDAVASTMVLLVSFLGAVVLNYSRQYLAGDPRLSRFFSWMSLTLASVLTVVLAGHLLVLVGAWISTSLCLHRLLLHHPDRPGAVFSARKKFVFSRAGDICLLAASLLLYFNHGSWFLDDVFASIAAGNTGGLMLVGFLLVICAAMKSAQFPFHSWLPDTMETPTPVSAFMHAGIINAGGFLIVRFSPLYSHASAALITLVIIGTISAAFGAVAMLVQPSVKRSLAYSTIAQMGFMLLQCGLGAYGLAMIHIVAHSLYKAHAFLSAGSTIGVAPRAAIPLKTPALMVGVMVAVLLVMAGATSLHVFMPLAPAHSIVFLIVLSLAIAYGIARATSAHTSLGMFAKSIGLAVVVAGLTFLLHAASNMLYEGLPVVKNAPWVLGFVGFVFVILFLFQALMWRAQDYALGRWLYVHALNGFYVATHANRLLGKLWPRHPIS